MHERKVGIIIDAFSTGKGLSAEFSKKGIECIHVRSTSALPSHYSHDEKKHIENLMYLGSPYNAGDLEAFIAILYSIAYEKKYTYVFCIPGSESGVELADAISHKLKLQSNGISLSRERRNKYLMTEAVKKVGVKTVQHFKSHSSEEIFEWVKNVKNYPIVLKPLESASNDHIFFCGSSEEISFSCDKILNSVNLFGQVNQEVLAQSFNYGQEYIVNTVSLDGKHFLSEILRIIKKPNTIIYDRAEFVHADEKEYKILFEHTKLVLNALSIRHGAGTTEWKYTPDGGPVFIECAARLMGGALVTFYEELGGFSQFSLLVEAYADPEKFSERFTEDKTKKNLLCEKKKKFGLDVVLISDCSGVLQRELDVNIFKDNLDNLHGDPLIGLKPGSVIKPTVDYLSAPGEVHLISESRKKLYADYFKIRKIEKAGFYKSAVEGLPFFWNERKENSSLSEESVLKEKGIINKFYLKNR